MTSPSFKTRAKTYKKVDQGVRDLERRLFDVNVMINNQLGKNWRRKVEHHGAKAAVDLFSDDLFI